MGYRKHIFDLEKKMGTKEPAQDTSFVPFQDSGFLGGGGDLSDWSRTGIGDQNANYEMVLSRLDEDRRK